MVAVVGYYIQMVYRYDSVNRNYVNMMLRVPVINILVVEMNLHKQLRPERIRLDRKYDSLHRATSPVN